MSDLTQRLRAHVSDQWGSAKAAMHEAADEIERQQAVIGRLNSQIDHLGMKGRDSKARDEALMRQALEALEGADEIDVDMAGAMAALRKRLGETK